MISFTIHLKPQPKGRPRFWNGHAVTDPKTRAFEKAFRALAKPFAPKVPPEGPIYLFAVFNLTKPKRTLNSYPKRGDLDNLLKAVSDSCNGLFWVDDAQVVKIEAAKMWTAGPPFIHVRIEEIAV